MKQFGENIIRVERGMEEARLSSLRASIVPKIPNEKKVMTLHIAGRRREVKSTYHRADLNRVRLFGQCRNQRKRIARLVLIINAI